VDEVRVLGVLTPVRSQKRKDDPVDHASGVRRVWRNIKIWILRLLIGLRDYFVAFVRLPLPPAAQIDPDGNMIRFTRSIR